MICLGWPSCSESAPRPACIRTCAIVSVSVRTRVAVCVYVRVRAHVAVPATANTLPQACLGENRGGRLHHLLDLRDAKFLSADGVASLIAANCPATHTLVMLLVILW
jgi:hypothetical protein